MTFARPSAFHRCCAAAVAAAMLLQPMAAYAAPSINTSVLSEVPLQGLNPVKPNVVLTVDDSGSMSQEYLPDFAAEGPTNPGSPQIYYCRDGRHCGGIADSRNGPWIITVSDPPIRSSNHNRQYFDPAAVYFPGRSADGPILPHEQSNPGTWTAVYNDGFNGYPGTNFGGTINLVTGYPDTAWCNAQASNPPSAGDLATALPGGNGSKCRLNGRQYGAFNEPVSNLWSAPAIAAGYNYPNQYAATGVTTTCASANQYCIFNVRGDVLGNPYYYKIDGVQFCNSQDARGFGTGTCQTRWSQDVYRYVRYGTGAASFDPQAFTRVDIRTGGFEVNGSGTVTSTNPSGSGRTYAEEMSNFARWYTFYRSRLLAMKTAGGIAFSGLNEGTTRAGLHTLNENNALFLNVAPFDTAQKTTWFTNFYRVAAGGGTPLPDAVFRIGEYFKNSGLSTLPAATDPLHPTYGMCQKNYHLLATDGYWNSRLSLGSVGDTDNTVPSLPGPITGLTPGNSFPRPYFEGSISTSNTLADLAMQYWINDLRPTLPNRVKDIDGATWQHVTLYGLAIGLQGTVAGQAGLDAIKAGTASWPDPAANLVPGFSGAPEAGDDLWHAALNSRGEFLNADTPQALAENLVRVIRATTGQDGTGTSVGIAGAQLTASRNAGYQTSYSSTWWGDVKKYKLDPDTGALPVDSNGIPRDPAVWSAVNKLDELVLGTGWDTNRRIVTINDGGTGVPFRLASLSPSQQASLTAGWSASPAAVVPTAQVVLDYLRGDKSQELDPAVPRLRARERSLGDIVYSGAVAVGPPNLPYLDSGNPGYSTFVSNRASRTPMVYVGANDGMVHAFDDRPCGGGPNDTPPYACPANAGKEVWAFVPKALYSAGDPNDASHASDPAFQLASLTYREAGIPSFEHRFLVNATPRAWDVDFNNTNRSTPPGTNLWRTVLIGGLGAGGRSVYALNVTAPPYSTDGVTPLAEAAIASNVLWEFTDPNLGYIYDPPTIVKTFAYGWVVLVPSGFNNPGGKGFLYVLNPTDGAILQKLPLPNDVGNDADPTGLSTIRAFTASRRDPLALQAYGGDLRGNVWRFDLSDVNPTNWKVERIAELKDDANNPQPITTGIRIEVDQLNPVNDRYLFIGTGKLLGPADISSTAVRNSVYVIKDGTRLAPEPAPTTPYSRRDLNVVTGGTSGFSGTATGRGWYQDGTPDNLEKIGTDVLADVQTVVFAFSKPTNDPCEAPLSSRLIARDFITGASSLVAPGGSIVADYLITSGIAGMQLIQGQPGSGGTASGEIRALVTTMKGEVFSFAITPPASPALRHRVSWRLLNRN